MIFSKDILQQDLMEPGLSSEKHVMQGSKRLTRMT